MGKTCMPTYQVVQKPKLWPALSSTSILCMYVQPGLSLRSLHMLYAIRTTLINWHMLVQLQKVGGGGGA